MTGTPSGRCFPLLLGMNTRLTGLAFQGVDDRWISAVECFSWPLPRSVDPPGKAIAVCAKGAAQQAGPLVAARCVVGGYHRASCPDTVSAHMAGSPSA